MGKHEKLTSRIGFLMLSAGCAIGLGNVWRFPYIVGRNGGGLFVLLYLVFLLLVGLPVLVMEFSVGRAAGATAMRTASVLTPSRPLWRLQGPFALLGCLSLMMMYPVVTGWLLLYAWGYLAGDFVGLAATEITASFHHLLASPGVQLLALTVSLWAAAGICLAGLNRGVSRVSGYLMGMLFGFIVLMAVNSLGQPGAMRGVAYYLLPHGSGGQTWLRPSTVMDALGHSLFSLSVGIGCMTAFGSYIGKDHTLSGEAAWVCMFDTLVALLAGLVIIPACFAYAVEPGQGPGLVFATLPHVFVQMPGGRGWAFVFFAMLSTAAFTTLLAVLEAILAMVMEWTGWSRRRSVLVLMVVLPLLSLPCVLGFNVLKGVQPLGPGSRIMDFEDFVVSNVLLPLGALGIVIYCTSERGWGWRSFLAEANAGAGWRFPAWLRGYCTYVLPLLILLVFVMGLYDRFGG